MEKNQREYYLNEQMKAIQRELGQGEEGKSELDEIEDKIARIRLSKEARGKAQAEFKTPPDEPHECRSNGRPQLSRLGSSPALAQVFPAQTGLSRCRSGAGSRALWSGKG